MGIVEETGSGVGLLKKGDRVVMPFNVACGRCQNCEKGLTAYVFLEGKRVMVGFVPM
jgi:threonine dehydrogenase-like Zn-dependent dehydrogenase